MQTAVERLWRFPKPGHQRVLKLRGDAQQIFVNGEFSGGSSGFWDYTMYVNPYMVVRPEGHYTKHIYVNSERIASKIGNPEDFGAGDPTGQGDAVGRKIKMEEVVEENFNELFGNVPEMEQAAEQELGMSSGSTEPEHNSYWFTSDHLGSSAFVTDASGVAIQHMEIDRREIREPPLKPEQGREQYMAFGEVFVDQRRTGFGTPYKFNAKELDCESGYYYYSARYYDPRMARFLSVDPLAGEMPEWGSYTYTFNNPLKYIDPTGMGPEDPPDGGDDKNKLEYMVNSLKEVPNGFLYAIGKLKDQLAGESSKDKIGEGYNLTSKDKIGSDPDLPKADDYKPVEDFTKASLYNVALEHLFNGEDFDKKGVEENHTWKIRTNESQDTQWFTPIDTNNYEYEKPFMRVIDEDGNVEVFGD